ncbi:MAG: hypothetical protein Q9166_005102 [cf. Caloplaca sp. 2 TL-2023]
MTSLTPSFTRGSGSASLVSDVPSTYFGQTISIVPNPWQSSSHILTMSSHIITARRTLTITTQPSSSPISTSHSLHLKLHPKARIAARSAITLYPPIPGEPTSTLTQQTTKPTFSNPQQQNSSSSSPNIPASAFWAVLAALIFVLVLLALAFPVWYWLRNRHRHKSSRAYSPPSSWSSSNTQFTNGQQPSSPRSWYTSLQQQAQQLSPQQMQQLQILNQLQNPPPIATPTDPNRRALLARLAALNNPSILGAIPEDSTVLTSSSVYPGNERQVVNKNWANVKEKRLQEARERGEVCEMDVAGEGGKGEGGKKVRFREREWAVLASDGGGSRLEHNMEDSQLGGRKF